MNLQSPHTPRPVRFLEILQTTDTRLKVYGIAYGRPGPRPELIDAGKAWAARHLRDHPTRQAH